MFHYDPLWSFVFNERDLSLDFCEIYVPSYLSKADSLCPHELPAGTGGVADVEPAGIAIAVAALGNELVE